MKIQWYKRFICCMFAVILFGLGMCVEIKDVDSYLACESQQESETQKYSEQNNIISSDYCTNELLQRNTTYRINNNQKREHVRRLSNHVIFSSWNVQQKIFYLEEIFLPGDTNRTYSQEMIIEYIHRQDGDK